MVGGAVHSFLILGIVLNTASVIKGSKECTLEVYDGNELVSGLCIEEFDTSECTPFIESFNWEDLPLGFKMSPDAKPVQRPGVEGSFVEPGYSPYSYSGVDYLLPSMTVEFAPPFAISSREDIVGYMMTWHYENKTKCRMFKFNTTDLSLLEKDLRFRSFVESIANEKQFDIKIYSMPPPSSLEESQNEEAYVGLYLTSSNYIVVGGDPGKWYPTIGISTPQRGRVDVMISHSPPEYNLTMFQVKLVKLEDPNNYYRVIDYTGEVSTVEASGSVTFENVETDTYKVVVQVIDPYPDVDGKCLCWVTVTSGKDCEIACGNVGTEWFKVTGNSDEPKPTEGATIEDDSKSTAASPFTDVPSTAEPITEEDEDVISTVAPAEASSSWIEENKIGLIVGLTVGVLVLAGIIVFTLCRRNQRKESADKGILHRLSNGPVPVVAAPSANLSQKTVYIVHAEDHPAHINLVEKLAKFLQTHCHCKVVLPYWEDVHSMGPSRWSISAFQRADCVLFVDSEAAEKLLGTYVYNNQTYTAPQVSQNLTHQLLKLANDRILTVEETKEKLMAVHHRKTCGSQNYLMTPRTFYLPDGIPDLLMCIHGFSGRNAQAHRHALPVILKNLWNLSEGAELMAALKETSQYERKNPAWFRDRFGVLRPIYRPLLSKQSESSDSSTKSGDSGHDSLMSRDHSVSMQDLSSQEIRSSSWGKSPTSSHKEIQYQAINAQTCQLNAQDLIKAAGALYNNGECNGGLLMGGEADKRSIFTIGTNILDGSDAEKTSGSVIPPPDNLSAVGSMTFSDQVRNLNNEFDGQSQYTTTTSVVEENEELEKPACWNAALLQRLSPNPEELELSADGQYHSEPEEETRSSFEQSLQPPPCCVGADSFSTALQALNNEEDDDDELSDRITLEDSCRPDSVSI